MGPSNLDLEFQADWAIVSRDGCPLQVENLVGSCPEAQAPKLQCSGHQNTVVTVTSWTERAPQQLVQQSFKSFTMKASLRCKSILYSPDCHIRNVLQNARRHQRKRRGRRVQGRGLPSQHQEHCSGNRRCTDPGEPPLAAGNPSKFIWPTTPPPPPTGFYPPQERVRPSQRLPRLRVRPDAHRRDQPLLRPPDRRQVFFFPFPIRSPPAHR